MFALCIGITNVVFVAVFKVQAGSRTGDAELGVTRLQMIARTGAFGGEALLGGGAPKAGFDQKNHHLSRSCNLPFAILAYRQAHATILNL